MKLDISDDINALAEYAIQQGDNPTSAAVQEGALWMAARLTGEPFRDLQTLLAQAKARKAAGPSIPLPGMGAPTQTAMDLSTGLAHTRVDAGALLAETARAAVPPSTVAPVPVAPDEILGTYDADGDLVITRLAEPPKEADLSQPAAPGRSTLPTNGDFPRPDGTVVWPPESAPQPLSPEEMAEFVAQFGRPIQP